MSFVAKSFRVFVFRCCKAITLTLVGVLSALCLSLILILGTQIGTQWLLSTVTSYSNAQISYQQLHGNLLTKIHVTGFEYKNGDIHLNISDLKLSWKPQKLLNRSFYLEYLKLDGVRVENKNLPENEQNSDHALEQGFVLADINFPLNLILNEISVTDFLLITDPKDKPFLIDALTVRTDVSASSATVNIIQFDVKASEFEISSNGKLKLKADYPVEINSDLQLTLTDLPVVTSKGIIKGDFNTLAIKQSLGGDLQGNVDISLDNPFSGLAWNGKVNIKQIPVRLLDDSIDVKDASFDLSLVGEGDMNMAVLKPLTANLSNGEIILTGQIGWLPGRGLEPPRPCEH